MGATIVSISGFSSNVGKTTLLCDLLRLNTGWEAIKISRGHYRSCGKDPQACCISPLLGEKPLILSGRAATFAEGKDTGRYWAAGASNVHWLICTSEQVEQGAREALARVEGEGVFVEGTSFLKHVRADYSIMVAGTPVGEIKSSAARVIEQVSAIYAGRSEPEAGLLTTIREKLARRGGKLGDVPIYFERDLTLLAEQIGKAHAGTPPRPALVVPSAV
jgi:hypothetical protein